MKPYSFYCRSLLTGLSIVGAAALTSCQKDLPVILKENNHLISGKSVVFVAGYEFTGQFSIAKYWIDGKEVILSDGTNNAMANSIFITDNDIYIVGTDAGPVYWKNNEEIGLPVKTAKTYSSANSIYVSGNKVYIAGNDSSGAVYWKDDTEIFLNVTNAKGNFGYSSANSVFISGNDIYVAGSHGPNAVYWKNGVEVYLTNNTLDLYGSEIANSIYVSGGNVYVVGSAHYVGAVGPIPRYWKNGINESATLNNSNFDYYGTNSVFVFGNNVYICGFVLNTSSPFLNMAVYWNNGNETVLPGNSINLSTASSIYVKGNDVYVSGYDENNNYLVDAVYWKNGTEVKLTDGTSNALATSIFLK